MTHFRSLDPDNRFHAATPEESDAKLRAEGWAAGVDALRAVHDVYADATGDGELASAQFASLLHAVTVRPEPLRFADAQAPLIEGQPDIPDGVRYPSEPSAEWDEEPTLPREVVVATHGPVIVNWVGRALRRRGVRIYEADLRTKYAEVKGYSSGRGEVDVLLGTTPESLHVAPGTGFTVLTIHPGRGDWNVVASCARYTLQVVVWRDSRKLSGNDGLLGRVLDALRKW